MTEDERAIRETVGLWMSASRKGDIAAVLDLMTDDVVFLAPGQEPFGKQRFADLSAAMSNVRLDGSSTIQEIEVLGDWAFLRSFVEMTAMPPDGAPIMRRGQTLSIFRKGDDGKWRLTRDANLMTAVK